MRFPASFLDDLRARLPVSEVVGRRVALKKAGREWKGLSPVNKEKTPSFFVNDQKVFYTSTAKDEPGKDGTYKHAFETLLPLKAGTNTVTVVAREDEETAARQTFVLFREGEVPVAAAEGGKISATQ